MDPSQRLGEAAPPVDQNPDRYRRLFEGDRDGILLLDGNTGRVADANPALLSLFRVYFPLLPKPATAVPARAVAGLPRGTETILVVEDETTVRSMITVGLQLSGYRVLEVSSGEEAIQVWNNHAGEVDLLFTDVRMAGMSGVELCERLKRKKGALRVIISSGCSEEILKSEGLSGTGVTLLPKPYGIQALGLTVRRCLDER